MIILSTLMIPICGHSEKCSSLGQGDNISFTWALLGQDRGPSSQEY